ncbi:heavy-metal-associated domain-containing protein [Insolitispirillum peregrinum]|uniref:Copper chaperone n=1 Tax=Insolitispirillum peregrinum TaxID=80876 RepID=A0A1N7IL55_9PROT|nr:heavy-metal-associated domain-containing protein [Insolitispirillum peregrinum]SIS37782.1 copper chaperone [Insolitispirillum peregrinum]
MQKLYSVGGMTCQGCANGVRQAILKEIPAANVVVDLDKKTVSVEPASDDAVRRAVDAAGFDFMGPVL